MARLAYAKTLALLLLAACAPAPESEPVPGAEPTADGQTAEAAESAPGTTASAETMPALPRHVVIADAIRPRFAAWNPRLELVSILETRWGGAEEGAPPLYALAHGIRRDRAFANLLEDEAFGLFEIDPATGDVRETLGFVPTCRWLDCEARIASASPETVTLEWAGATYGDQAGSRTFARMGLDEWLIVPDERVGPITRAMTEADLLARFGDAAEPGEAYLAEGFCTPGVVLFRDTPNELAIGWTNDDRDRPAFVRVVRPGDWRLPDGVRVGTSLRELEALRGDAVEFSGFGWDYGGATSWTVDGGSVGLWLREDARERDAAARDPRYGELLGDRVVRSDHPLVREMGVYVGRMYITWAQHEVEEECG